MKYSELHRKYDKMQEPSYRLLVDGKKLETGEGARLTNIVCTVTTQREAGMLYLEGWVNPEEKRGTAWLDALQLGAPCKLELGYADRNKCVFSGFLYDIYWDDPLENGVMDLEAVFLDVRGRLMLSSCADAGAARTLSQLVGDILNQKCCTELASSRKIGAIPKDWDLPTQRRGPSDYDVACEAADFLGFEFYAFADELYFGPPRPSEKAELTLDGPLGLTRLRRRRSLAGQCAAVAVSGTDDKGERIYAKETRKRDSGFGVKGMSGVLTQELQMPETSARTMAQVQYLAKTRMAERQRRSGALLGWITGLPELRPGRYIEVSGMSKAVNGTHYVHTVQHILDENGFETYFEAED